MKQYTDITVLLDRSGSMDSIKESMETAYREFLKKHSEVSSTRITLIQFDDIDPQEVVYQNVPINSADPLKLRPRGNTPLIDAFVEAIDKTGRRLANMDEADRPDQVLFVTITDGQENASKRYRRSDVRERVSKQTENYKWQFVYLGANQDAIKEANTFGIGWQNALNYTASAAGTAGSWQGLIGNTVSYAQNVDRGARMRGFSKSQRATASAGNADLDKLNEQLEEDKQ